LVLVQVVIAGEQYECMSSDGIVFETSRQQSHLA
jgi:hypothetical protein